jgi:hypothetical protein
MSETTLPLGFEISNKSVEREQEGWARSLSVADNAVPTCSSFFSSYKFGVSDFRGVVPTANGLIPPHLDRTFVEWQTSPAESAEATIFTWIGGSQVRPVSAAYPAVNAVLFINDVECLRFPLGRHNDWSVSEDDITLSFESRRFQSLVEIPQRVLAPDGVSGFYRLSVPSRLLTAGEPLRLRVAILPIQGHKEAFFFVSPRADALQVNLKILRDEVVRLQQDLIQFRQSHEQLYMQLYPELFPARIKGVRGVVHQDETKHLHPPMITVMHDGEIVVTFREATDHLAPDGKMILKRSYDGGSTWGDKEVMLDLGNRDHRASPIFELPNGDWVTTDYRAGSEYSERGEWDTEKATYGASLWAAWSADKGRHWELSTDPLTVPGAPYQYCEVERHMIRLPSGRLLVPANYLDGSTHDGKVTFDVYRIAIFYSDNDGRNWQVLTSLPANPYTIGECTLLKTAEGKIVLLSRTQWGGKGSDEKGGLLQSDSYDDGATWSEWRQTGMSSMGSPGHLLQLQDGRILCTHASRLYPGSIFVTVSDDEGITWNTESTRIVANDVVNFDACYPTTGQRKDGALITVWYANLFGKFFIPSLTYHPEQI